MAALGGGGDCDEAGMEKQLLICIKRASMSIVDLLMCFCRGWEDGWEGRGIFHVVVVDTKERENGGIKRSCR